MNSVFWKYIVDFPEFKSIQQIAQKYYTQNGTSSNQTGGAKTKRYKYKGYSFSVDFSKKGDMIDISIFTHQKNPLSCATLLINPEGRGALQNMSFMSECMEPPYESETGGGSIILQLVLRIIEIHKDQYGIKQITVSDNSTKQCPGCQKEIILSDMYFLLHGNTWYGRYGFRPKKDTYWYDAYIKNQQIINATLTNDVPLYDYISEVVNEYKLPGIKLDNIKKFIDAMHGKPLMKTLQIFLKYFKKYCCVFTYIAPKIMNKLEMERFHRQIFYLDV